MSTRRTITRLVTATLLTAWVLAAPRPPAVAAPSRLSGLQGQVDSVAVARLIAESWLSGAPAGPEWLREEQLRRVYRARGGSPVFVGSAAGLARADDLRQALGGAAGHGLPPERYRTAPLDSLAGALATAPAPSFWDRFRPDATSVPRARALALARIDALLVDRYLVLAADLGGILEPDSTDTLVTRLSDGPPPSIIDWAPTHPQYRRLQEVLAAYRKVADAGGWPGIDEGKKLVKGDHDPRVGQLRARLDAEARLLAGTAPPVPADPSLFDQELKERVIAFQARHALDDDGVAGKGTIADMNVSAAERVRQLERTLERWRRWPRGEAGYRVEVNIPGMMLNLYDGGVPVWTSRTVVGSGKESPAWKGKTSIAETPEMIDEIETVEVNPKWHIPEIITRTELLAKEKQKPGYLDRGGYEWYEPWSGNFGPASEVPESTWTDPKKRLFLRQRSGDANALGRIKFVFHNRFAVYLHDTPDKQYFKRGRRNFSHGCVRVQDPGALAESLFVHSAEKPPKPLKEMLRTDKRVVINMRPPVPIHLVYRTTWVDPDGTVHFLPDIYGWDAAMDPVPAPLSAGAAVGRGGGEPRSGPPGH